LGLAQLGTGAWSDQLGREGADRRRALAQALGIAGLALLNSYGRWIAAALAMDRYARDGDHDHGAWHHDAMTSHLGLVLDCREPETLAAFWGDALGYRRIGGAGNYFLLLPPEGQPGPQLLLQRVPEPKTGKNRMHFDIHTPDIGGEADRLVTLGATRVQEAHLSEHGSTWILMHDPEGNEFCVCDAGDHS
jgi:predicted enzyme related to lactoylglutathione lyase